MHDINKLVSQIENGNNNVRRISKNDIIKQINKYGKWEGWMTTSNVHPNDPGAYFKTCTHEIFLRSHLIPDEHGNTQFERSIASKWHNYSDKNGHSTIFYEFN